MLSIELSVEDMEREIRNTAGAVISDVDVMRAHPTFGRTKTGIRFRVAFLHGLVAMYAVTTGQTANALSVNPRRVDFTDPDTQQRITDALNLAESL